MAVTLIEHETGAWWVGNPRAVTELEAGALRDDPTIRRLTADEIEANADLRRYRDGVDVDLLAYVAFADGPYGRFRLAAIFPEPPTNSEPIVVCLDGPRFPEASEHRNGPVELCLYFRGDPPERRWRARDGLLRLFDLGRRHLFGEYYWREHSRWPIEEAPHGDAATPAPSNPALELPPLPRPGRNEPCSCGSGKKAKRCCWR